MKGNIFSYSGEEFSVERFKARKNSIINAINNGKRSPCTGCRFLEKKVWPKNEHLINHIIIGHYGLCNFKCAYCYTVTDAPLNKQPYNAYTTIKSMKEMGILSPTCQIDWVNGEPVILSEFYPVMEMAYNSGMRSTILTNCTIYSDVVAKGLLNKTMSVVCSVDAGTRETYNLIKGRDSYDKVWDTINRYAKLNSENVILKYIFTDDNSNEIDVIGFVSKCKAANIGNIHISQDVMKYRSRRSEKIQSLPPEIINSVINMLFEAYKVNIKTEILSEYFIDKDIWLIKLKLLQTMAMSDFIGNELYIKALMDSFANELADDLNKVQMNDINASGNKVTEYVVKSVANVLSKLSIRI